MGDLWVKALILVSMKIMWINVIIHPNKQSLGHLGEQKAYRGFLYKINEILL